MADLTIPTNYLRPAIAEKLPPETRHKIWAVCDQAAALHGSVLAMSDRTSEALDGKQNVERELRRQREAGQHGLRVDGQMITRLEKDLERATAEHERLKASKGEIEQNFQATKRLEQAMLDFAREHASREFRRVVAKVPKSATVASVRSEIEKVNQELATVQTAPAPASDLRERMVAEVDGIAAKGEPSISLRTREGAPLNLSHRLALHVQNADRGTLIGDAGASFFVWLLRDHVVDRLSELIGPDARGALSNSERERRVNELEAKKLDLERQEEAMILAAAAQGRTIARRDDADMRAVLEIEVQ